MESLEKSLEKTFRFLIESWERFLKECSKKSWEKSIKGMTRGISGEISKDFLNESWEGRMNPGIISYWVKEIW